MINGVSLMPHPMNNCKCGTILAQPQLIYMKGVSDCNHTDCLDLPRKWNKRRVKRNFFHLEMEMCCDVVGYV